MNGGIPWFVYAFSLGIGSSLHCLGMCGPLVMSMPFGHERRWIQGLRFASYSVSKACMYGIMGLLPGLMGWSIKEIIGPWWISLIAGILVLLVIMVPGLKGFTFFPKRIADLIKAKYQLIYNKPRWYYFILAGILNALLPCAMIWIALTASIATASPFDGFGFMFYFGLGTIPALGLVQFGKIWFLYRFKAQARMTSRIITWMLAIVLILRGVLPGVIHSLGHSGERITTCNLPAL